jgi:hypothetical protein
MTPMLTGPYCGLWENSRTIFAVCTGIPSEGRPIHIAKSYGAHWGFLAWVKERGNPRIIVTDALSTLKAVEHITVSFGIDLLVLNAKTVDDIRQACGLNARPPRYSALLLARIGQIPSLATICARPHKPYQLSLF